VPSDLPFITEKDGVRLAVRLTPRANKNRLDGLMRGVDGRPALKLRLMAPPVEGEANRALIAFVSGALGLRHADVRIQSGETARLKILRLSGDPAVITARLTAWIGASLVNSGLPRISN